MARPAPAAPSAPPFVVLHPVERLLSGVPDDVFSGRLGEACGKRGANGLSWVRSGPDQKITKGVCASFDSGRKSLHRGKKVPGNAVSDIFQSIVELCGPGLARFKRGGERFLHLSFAHGGLRELVELRRNSGHFLVVTAARLRVDGFEAFNCAASAGIGEQLPHPFLVALGLFQGGEDDRSRVHVVDVNASSFELLAALGLRKGRGERADRGRSLRR
ncbi:hypothetical protein OUZ56_032631 [Daphnia magna]|uniref:Uncharacterized protein n=1 Tax=Daphnia magna TaxID=35525 RepID=A0ABR0B9G3_9CRUS|nr:hypothetical protein OUZ56_032631 [Daphnia magna]